MEKVYRKTLVGIEPTFTIRVRKERTHHLLSFGDDFCAVCVLVGKPHSAGVSNVANIIINKEKTSNNGFLSFLNTSIIHQ